MRRILPLLLLGALAGLLAPPAHAVDYRADLFYPSADQTGLRAAVGTGFGACGAGSAGNSCRASGVLSAFAAQSVAIPAFNGADFVFTPPAGTTILGGSVTMRHRTTDPGIHARLLYHAPGAVWTSTALADTAVATDTLVEIPPGVAQFGPSLYARTAVPAGRIASPNSNVLEVLRIGVWLRDSGLPTLAVRADGAFADGVWHRGVVCAHADATDGGLGIYGVYLDIDGQKVGVGAPPGPILQPRPRAFGANLCIDSHLLHDGYLSAGFRATDGPAFGGNAAVPVARAIRIDNTPPLLAGTVPPDTSARQPLVVVRSSDALSGLAELSATIGGVAVALGPVADGTWQGIPVTPLDARAARRALPRHRRGRQRHRDGSHLHVADRVAPVWTASPAVPTASRSRHETPRAACAPAHPRSRWTGAMSSGRALRRRHLPLRGAGAARRRPARGDRPRDRQRRQRDHEDGRSPSRRPGAARDARRRSAGRSGTARAAVLGRRHDGRAGHDPRHVRASARPPPSAACGSVRVAGRAAAAPPSPTSAASPTWCSTAAAGHAGRPRRRCPGAARGRWRAASRWSPGASASRASSRARCCRPRPVSSSRPTRRAAGGPFARSA